MKRETFYPRIYLSHLEGHTFKPCKIIARTRGTFQYCPRAWSRYPLQGQRPPWCERALPKSPRGSCLLRPPGFDRTVNCRSVQGCKYPPRCCQAANTSLEISFGNTNVIVLHVTNICFVEGDKVSWSYDFDIKFYRIRLILSFPFPLFFYIKIIYLYILY